MRGLTGIEAKLLQLADTEYFMGAEEGEARDSLLARRCLRYTGVGYDPVLGEYDSFDVTPLGRIALSLWKAGIARVR